MNRPLGYARHAPLRHPHIVSIHDFDVENGIPFLVMNYAPHGNLRQRHPKGTRLSPPVILPYLEQVADALQYAHMPPGATIQLYRYGKQRNCPLNRLYGIKNM